MEHIVEAQTFDESGRLFTTNAAGAEHGDFLTFKLVTVLLNPFRKFAECLGVRVKCTFKRADSIFVIVARINDDSVFIGNQRIPVLGRDIGANALQRINPVDTHGNDFALQPHFHAIERHLAGM